MKKPKIAGIILPKKKPIIAGTKTTETTETAQKSKFYSKRDFAIAKKALAEMKQSKWPASLKTEKKHLHKYPEFYKYLNDPPQ